MPSPWRFMYPHKNPSHPDLRGMWASESEAREYRGLVLAPCYDPRREQAIGGWWELRHKLTCDPLLFIRAGDDEEAEEYATQVAEMAAWEHMRVIPEWTSPPHRLELIDYLRSTNQVFYQPSFDDLWSKFSDEAVSDDWVDDVPFGTTRRSS